MSSINPHPVPGAVVRNVSGAREELLTVALVRDVGSGLLEENVRHGTWTGIMDGHHGWASWGHHASWVCVVVLWMDGCHGTLQLTMCTLHSMTLMHWIHMYLFI